MHNTLSHTGRTEPIRRTPTMPGDRVSMRTTHEATLLEVDVTHVRRLIRVANRGGESAVSLLAWLVWNVAATLESDGPVISVFGGEPNGPSGRVAVSVIVDRRVGPHRVALPVVITAANARTVDDIETTIHKARTTPVDVAGFVTGRPTGFVAAVFRAVPSRLQAGLLRCAVRRHRNPRDVQSDVVISSAGMGGRVRGWFIPSGNYALCIGLGAVAPKGVVVNGTIESRDVLHMTVVAAGSSVEAQTVNRWVSRLLRSMARAEGPGLR